MIYLDNNATTIMTPEIKQSMLDWCNKGNPSADYAAAKSTRKMMDGFRVLISRQSGLTDDYKIIFTSGASEANCTMFAMVIGHQNNTKPHVIMSEIEHKSLIDIANSYVARNMITVTFIKPTYSGHIRPSDILAAIEPTTCLICVMHANNETGAINDISKIGAIARKYAICFHCDTVQAYGKMPVDGTLVDSFCISFHKLHGPPGVGCLAIRKQFIGDPIIFGSQNDSLRGGTENVPGIGASLTAIKYTLTDRSSKNETMVDIKKYIMDAIAAKLPTQSYTMYKKNTNVQKPNLEIVFLSSATEYYLCNTILLSVVKRIKPMICNLAIKTKLMEKGIIISVGSACNTASPKASHVLYAMDADELIRKGALRISLGDSTTLDDAKKFVAEFIPIVLTS